LSAQSASRLFAVDAFPLNSLECATIDTKENMLLPEKMTERKAPEQVTYHHLFQHGDTEKLLSKTCGATRISYSTSDERLEESHYKAGGTATTVIGHWSTRVIRSGKDPTGCGRWSYVCLG
jgi:hypothetical protein